MKPWGAILNVATLLKITNCLRDDTVRYPEPSISIKLDSWYGMLFKKRSISQFEGFIIILRKAYEYLSVFIAEN